MCIFCCCCFTAMSRSLSLDLEQKLLFMSHFCQFWFQMKCFGCFTVLYGVRYYFFYIPVCYQFFQVLVYSWLAELLVFVFNLHGLLHFTVCSLFPSRIFVTITLFLLLFLINVLSYIMHLLMLKQHCKFRINTTLSCCIMCFSHCHI